MHQSTIPHHLPCSFTQRIRREHVDKGHVYDLGRYANETGQEVKIGQADDEVVVSAGRQTMTEGEADQGIPDNSRHHQNSQNQHGGNQHFRLLAVELCQREAGVDWRVRHCHHNFRLLNCVRERLVLAG